MSGGRYGFASVHTPYVLFLSILVACGGDREAGAPAGDTGQTPGASASAAAGSSDTVRSVNPDTAAAAVAGRSDTAGSASKSGAVAPATPPKKTPASPKPATPAEPKPAAPRRPPATMEAPDTQRAATAVETTATAPAPVEASASAPAEAGAPLRDVYHQAPLDTVTQQVYDGWKQYNLNCARCHGEDVQGTTIAPHLIVSLQPGGSIPTKELFIQTVCAGRPEKGMPAWCPLGMEMGKIEAIHSYVKGRSDGKLHVGRPALRQ